MFDIKPPSEIIPSLQPPGKILNSFDIETYPNYILIMPVTFTIIDGKKKILNVSRYEMLNGIYYLNRERCTLDEVKPHLMAVLRRSTNVSFNGIKYDMLILTAFVNGANNAVLKQINDEIIPGGKGPSMQPWQFEKKYGSKLLNIDHIDLIEVAFGTASLKVYGARLKSKLLRELPIHHNDIISIAQTDELNEYCYNDNIVTINLYIDCMPALALREKLSAEYGVDFRSKSDAQIGEGILIKECEVRNIKLKKPNVKTIQRQFKYEAPPFISFQTSHMQNVLDVCSSTVFEVSTKTNKVNLPPEVSKMIKLGTGANQVSYKMGIGGLHSVTKGGTFVSDDEYDVFEIDVSSFYPNIIINSGFYIPSIGKETFIDIYSSIVDKKNVASKRLKEIDSELEMLKKML